MSAGDVGQGPTVARSPAALSVRGLRKAFGPKVAVAGIDLDIPHGSFFGLVGPNGAGSIEVWRDRS